MLTQLICYLARISGLPWLVRRLVQRRVVTIVTYHRLDPETADRHFALLQRLYTPISLQAYLDARREGLLHRLPARSLIVTIDDGHKSVARLKPVLERRRMPVTVFLCSDFVDTTRRFWFLAPGLAPDLCQRLKVLPDDLRLQTLRQNGFDNSVEYGERDGLTLAEVRELSPHVDFQSHSVTHPILPMCGVDKARDEIARSRRELERKLETTINAFAYPNGSYGEREALLTRDAGYECGLTMDPGFNREATPLYGLKRFAVPDDCGVHELALRACGMWALLRHVRLSLRGRGRTPMLVSARGSAATSL
jgi:peptidoglycan/xylan/chitin deacetylase (PgdA/CDA1 family)